MIRLPWQKLLLVRTARGAPDTGGAPSDMQPSGPSGASPVDPDTTPRDGVRGERSRFIAGGAQSLQSRMTSLLAAGLMVSVGAGMLAWYYTEALSRPAATRPPVNTSVSEAAGEGITVPRFEPDGEARAQTSITSLGSARSVLPPVPPVPAPQLPASGLFVPAATLPPESSLGPSLVRAPGGLPPGYGEPPQSSPRQRALERRLSGRVFANGMGTSSAVPFGNAQAQTPQDNPRGNALETLLRPSVLSATRAQVLPTQRLLLPKGTFIDCTLETAIDSTLPGMTTCVTATDTFGADGTVVLLERGTRLIGETRGEVRQGEARVFVVWTDARTPSGVAVRLDSPGTDALGRSGLEGTVNRHFWQRFGAAALVSTIDGVVQSEVQSSSRGGTVVLDPTASEDVLTEILRGTVNIPPTIRVRNGARIQVLVARDVDFRSVYELEPR